MNKQAGRHTKQPSHSIRVIDFFAKDVRRVLRQCDAPSNWTDEDAAFLFRHATEELFLITDSFTPAKQRANRFVGLSSEAEGRMPIILAKLYQMMQGRITRGGHASYVWLVVASIALRMEDLHNWECSPGIAVAEPCVQGNLNTLQVIRYSKDPAVGRHLRQEIWRFWNEKAAVLADEFSERLGLPIPVKPPIPVKGISVKGPISVKVIEKARKTIRDIDPFQFPPSPLHM